MTEKNNMKHTVKWDFFNKNIWAVYGQSYLAALNPALKSLKLAHPVSGSSSWVLPDRGDSAQAVGVVSIATLPSIGTSSKLAVQAGQETEQWTDVETNWLFGILSMAECYLTAEVYALIIYVWLSMWPNRGWKENRLAP